MNPARVEAARRAKVARCARRALDLTQRAFAPVVGVTQTTIARWESPNEGRPEYAPSDTAFALLRLIAADPALAARVLGGAVRKARRGRA